MWKVKIKPFVAVRKGEETIYGEAEVEFTFDDSELVVATEFCEKIIERSNIKTFELRKEQ